MARTLGSVLGFSKQTEMLVMTVVTLLINIFDMTLFEIGNNLEQVWNAPLDVTKFSPQIQHIIKILLSGVVFVRTFSLHLYIAFLIAMFWPCFFGTRPTLMLPWLTVSALKNIGTGFITFGTGFYTCTIYGPFRPACFRFIGSQILDLSPAVYMWIVGLSLYRDLRKPPPIDKEALKLTEEQELNIALRRRKVKSMIDGDVLRKQIESQRHFDVENKSGVEQIDKILKISRSLDSLLDVMASEAEVFDTDDLEYACEGLEIPEQVVMFLGINKSEIDRIKQNKRMNIELPLFSIRVKKKQQNIGNTIVEKESPLFLLPKTSLYTPSVKPLRPTKSELKSPKDFLKLKTPSDFMKPLPETELHSPKPPKLNIIEENEDRHFSSKWEMYDMKKISESTIKEQSVRSITSNEKQKSSEEIVAHTNYTDTLSDSLSTEIPVRKSIPILIPRKVSHEIACQVSTLSKRILNASAREISEQFSKQSSIEKKNSRRPISSNSRGSRKSIRLGTKDNSYLNIHLFKKELVDTIEK